MNIHYLMNFSVYTIAMIGLICIAVILYKKVIGITLGTNKKGLICVEDVLHIAPRKSLYIIKAKGQEFLIASDADRTSLIAKLSEDFSQIEDSLLQNNEIN